MIGRFIVKGSISKEMKYCRVLRIEDFSGEECIIVKAMNPDYTILLPSIQLIITEKGSPIAHLAIIAREYGVPVVLVQGITNKLAQKGKISINQKEGGIDVKAI
jgi:rifampicin phosphotransferase